MKLSGNIMYQITTDSPRMYIEEVVYLIVLASPGKTDALGLVLSECRCWL